LTTKTIVYRTEALRSGHFVNEARVDVRSVDGTVVRPVYVSAAVTVGEFEGEISAPGWQPPDWGFDDAGYSNEPTCEGICTLAS